MDESHRSSRTLTHLPGSFSKHLVVLIPLAMSAGLVTGLVIDVRPLQSLVLPMTMLMVYPMLVNFLPAQALDLRDSRAVGLALALDFLALPALAWLLARLFIAESPGLFVGMVFAGLFPTSGMTISWTGFAEGNVGAAVKMTVIGLVAASLLAPVYLQVLAGTVVPVDMLEVLRTVVFVVGVPLVATVLGRSLLPRADAIAVVYGTVMRNLSIALGIAMASFGAEAALVLAAAYIVQVQSAAWYVKLTDRAFGPARVIAEPKAEAA